MTRAIKVNLPFFLKFNDAPTAIVMIAKKRTKRRDDDIASKFNVDRNALMKVIAIKQITASILIVYTSFIPYLKIQKSIALYHISVM